jgi:hypothetical protein
MIGSSMRRTLMLFNSPTFLIFFCISCSVHTNAREAYALALGRDTDRIVWAGQTPFQRRTAARQRATRTCHRIRSLLYELNPARVVHGPGVQRLPNHTVERHRQAHDRSYLFMAAAICLASSRRRDLP